MAPGGLEIALLGLPAVAVFAAIALFGVDVLWWDDWDAIGRFLLETRAHGIDWRVLWVQDNEHRILLGRLFFLADSQLGPSPLRLMLVSQCVLTAAFALLVPMVRGAVRAWPATPRRTFLLLSSALFFSFTQYENFFWAVQLGWSLALFGFLLAMTGVQREETGRTVVGISISVASTAHWVAAVPVVLLGQLLWVRRHRGTERSRGAVIRLVGLTVYSSALLIFYTRDWQFPPYHPSPALSLQHPLRAAAFAIHELGAPFAWLSGQRDLLFPILAGLLFLSVSVKALRDGALHQGDLEPYLLAGTLSWVALLTLGRSSFGAQQVQQSRYAICVISGWTALAALVARLYGASRRARQAILLVLAAAALSSAFALRYVVTTDFPQRRAAKECLTKFLDGVLSLEDEGCLQPLYPSVKTVKRVARRLNRQGLLPPGRPSQSQNPEAP